MRTARRWGGVLVNLKVPRGAGSSGRSHSSPRQCQLRRGQGGHIPQMIENVQDLCDATANRLGFHISEVALAGEHEVDRGEILSLAGITDRSSLLFLDAARARTRLLTNPWIAEAAVLKLYPDRLRIEIRNANRLRFGKRMAVSR